MVNTYEDWDDVALDDESGSMPVFTDLTEKEKRFAQEFLVDCNQTSAYMRAFPHASERSASSAASKLMRKPSVIRYLASLRKTKETQLELSRSAVLQELAAISLTRFTDIATWSDSGTPDFVASKDLPEHAKAAIAGIDYSETFNEETGTTKHIKVKTHSKLTALTLAGKYLGLFEDLERAFNVLEKYGYISKKLPWGYISLDSVQDENPTIIQTGWGTVIVNPCCEMPFDKDLLGKHKEINFLPTE